MKRLIVGLFVILTLNSLSLIHACTIIMAAQGDKVLTGNNEDYKFPFTSVWFIPASDGEYGRMCFGFKFTDYGLAACGGMNDQGLFIDGNGLDQRTGWKPEEGKERFPGIVEAYVLAHCASVDDVIAFFKEYNVGILSRGKFLAADKNGDSVVVEWSQGKTQFLRKKGNYQISTNFVQSNYQPGSYPCHRYTLAEKIFSGADNYSVDLIRSILSATHFDGYRGTSITLYSYICDLGKGDVYIYNFHNFEDVVKLNIHQELKKGKKAYSIVSLFPYETFAEKVFKERMTKPSADVLLEVITNQGVDKAIESYHEMKTQFRIQKVYRYDISERQINTLGYRLLRMERLDDAVEVFKLNVAEHPESANVYDSLGEIYMTRGDKELAIKNFKKSLELNPKNNNAVKMLKQLRGEK